MDFSRLVHGEGEGNLNLVQVRLLRRPEIDRVLHRLGHAHVDVKGVLHTERQFKN